MVRKLAFLFLTVSGLTRPLWAAHALVDETVSPQSGSRNKRIRTAAEIQITIPNFKPEQEAEKKTITEIGGEIRASLTDSDLLALTDLQNKLQAVPDIDPKKI